MYSNEEYLDQTITQFPGPQEYLRRLCEEEKQKTKIEIEKEFEQFREKNEELVKDAMELFECNTSAFSKSFSKDSKHELQLLESDNPDYDLLKRSLGLSAKTNQLNKYSNKNVAIRIYRVESNVERCRCPSLLLLHVTKRSNVEGILKEGLRPSSSGRLGPGIYMTNSFEIAQGYGQNYAKEDGSAKDLTYFFVSKVNETLVGSGRLCEECKNYQYVKTGEHLFGKKTTSTVFIKSSFPCLDSSFRYEPILKVFDGNSYSKKQVEFKNSPACKFDSDGNEIHSGTFQVGNDEMRIAVAHHDLVTLKYFIEIEIKQSARELAKHILYDELDETKFSKDPPISDRLNDTLTENSPVSSKHCSMNAFVAELEKEISANQQEKVELVKHQFECKVKSFMRQLLFETSTILKTDNCAKYKAELLQASDPDHQFVLGSMTKMSLYGPPEILKIFRINTVDEFEVEKMRGSSLYLRGVKANKVTNVLTRGYPENHKDLLEQCDCGVGDCYCYASTGLDRQLGLGLSHCVTNGQAGKLSFVFVSSDGKCADEETFSNYDTRGCCFKTRKGIIGQLVGLIPAYLVVFSVQ